MKVGRYLLMLLLAGAAAGVLLVSPPAARAVRFADVPSDYAYKRQIEVLAQLGVISGYEDGRFGPEDPILRQQFCKMVILAMRLPVGEKDVSPFGDVEDSGEAGLFPDNYVAAAAREGITNGVRPGTATSRPLFAPYARITLAQVMTMAVRGAGEPLADPPGSYRGIFGDFDPVHGPAAELAQYNGLLRELLLTGTDGRVTDPWRPATRGEAAALLYNLMGTDPEGLAGRFLGVSSDLVTYFRLQGRTAERFTVPLNELARLYNKWGRIFGIRADLAWAQMVHETGFGEYGGDVSPDQNNFAGIGATGGVPGNSFATAELGVIAHYAHLAWYLYPEHFDTEYCRAVPGDAVITQGGDPRHFVIDGKVHRGNVRTVLDLGGKWAPSPDYGAAVLGHALGIPTTRGW